MKRKTNSTVVYKKGIVHIFDGVLRENIYIAYGMKEKQFRHVVKSTTGNDLSEVALKVGWFARIPCNYPGVGDTFWVWTREKDMVTLVHECTHAAFNLLNEIIDVRQADEIVARLTEYLFRMTLEAKG